MIDLGLGPLFDRIEAACGKRLTDWLTRLGAIAIAVAFLSVILLATKGLIEFVGEHFGWKNTAWVLVIGFASGTIGTVLAHFGIGYLLRPLFRRRIFRLMDRLAETDPEFAAFSGNREQVLDQWANTLWEMTERVRETQRRSDDTLEDAKAIRAEADQIRLEANRQLDKVRELVTKAAALGKGDDGNQQ